MRNQRLCKALETLVDECKSIDGRTRILKLVYLTDKAWYEKTGKTYTEAQYFRWNHGPFAREVLNALEWMNGVEIVQSEYQHAAGNGYTYEPGSHTRLAEVKLDPAFREILLATAAEWRERSLKSLLAHVYADPTFKATQFGERLLA